MSLLWEVPLAVVVGVLVVITFNLLAIALAWIAVGAEALFYKVRSLLVLSGK